MEVDLAVAASLDEVLSRVLLHDHGDVGMLFGKAAEQARQKVGRDGRNGAEANASAASGLGEFGKGVLHELEDVFRPFEQQLAELGEHDFAGFAFKERLTEMVFEFLDRTAQRGLREMQLLGSTREVFRAGQCGELFEKLEVKIAAHG